MLQIGFALLFIIFGIYGLLKSEIPLVGKRKISGGAARVVGILLILAGLGVFVGCSAIGSVIR